MSYSNENHTKCYCVRCSKITEQKPEWVEQFNDENGEYDYQWSTCIDCNTLNGEAIEWYRYGEEVAI